MKNDGKWAFGAGFLLAAIPLTFWLLTLTYGDNGWRVALAIIIEFSAGFATRTLYLRRSRKMNKAN